MLLLQVDLPEVPINGDMSAWFGWAMTVLALVIIASLTYLIRTSNRNEGYATKSFERLVTTLERSQIAAEDRLNKAWFEHDRDRTAFMHQQEELSRTLSSIAANSDKNQLAIAAELKEIKDEVRKNYGGRS